MFRSSIEYLLNKAAIVEYASATVLYLGFPEMGNPEEDDDQWAICRITYSTADADTYPRTIKTEWANGARLAGVNWTDRASYTYKYLV